MRAQHSNAAVRCLLLIRQGKLTVACSSCSWFLFISRCFRLHSRCRSLFPRCSSAAGTCCPSPPSPSSSSDDSDVEASATRKARVAAESAESAELAAYLSSPSTYVSSTPGLVLPASEISERLEAESLLARLKSHQAGVMKSRSMATKELEGMKIAMKKVRRDTEELLKNQQQNIATMGRKLH